MRKAALVPSFALNARRKEPSALSPMPSCRTTFARRTSVQPESTSARSTPTCFEWHDRQITDITRGDIKELLREKARGAPTSANRLKSLISKIFAWALKEEIIEASPAMKLDPPGGDENERERNLTADEIKIAWDAFDKIGYPWGPLWKMLLVTGQRRGEVAGMKWREITAEGWRLPGERAKKGKGHLVPLSTLAREILADVPEIGKHVFTIRKDQPPKGWSRATRRLYALTPAIADWHPHDLRRTFATQLRSLGDRSLGGEQAAEPRRGRRDQGL